MRVRAILSAAGAQRPALARLLPAGVLDCKIDGPTLRYPSAILSAFPKGEQYSYLGILAESLLREPVAGVAELQAEMRTLGVHAERAAKAAASKTTPPFLAAIAETRRLLEMLGGATEAEFEPAIAAGSVVGHPDILTRTQVFEVKLTGEPMRHWRDFLMQVFAYASLAPAATHVHLVLPLQKTIWSYDVRGWTERAAYLTKMQSIATAVLGSQRGATSEYDLAALSLCARFRIGVHLSKKGGIYETLVGADPRFPYQLFLGSSMNTKIAVKDAEIARVRALVESHKLRIFIHSPYLLNLCSPPEETADNYIQECLKKLLTVGAAMGFRGVVVHVGKNTKKSSAGMEAQRRNLQAIIEEAATPECPLLLETPAGQGTETLRTWEEFFGLLVEINDTRLRACIDTCHVFACGHDPVEYIERTLSECPEMLKLVHFNDSASARGSCVDRHARIGTGQIGFKPLERIATAVAAAWIPCVNE